MERRQANERSRTGPAHCTDLQAELFGMAQTQARNANGLRRQDKLDVKRDNA